jgi:hypothetical protein
VYVRNFPLRCLTLLFSLLILQSCASLPENGGTSPATLLDSPDRASVNILADHTLEGLWQGVSRAGCASPNGTHCGAVADIELTMLQDNQQLTGFYRCEPVNMPCVLNEAGQLSNVEVSGSSLKFLATRPGNTSCFFRGFFSGDQMRGAYHCPEAVGLPERGSFQVKRSY